MAKFCELGIESDVVIGNGIEIEELFNRRILIEKIIIQPTKYPGKNASGITNANISCACHIQRIARRKRRLSHPKKRWNTRCGKTFLFYRVGHFDFCNSKGGKQFAHHKQETK